VTQPATHAAQSHAVAAHEPPYITLAFIVKV